MKTLDLIELLVFLASASWCIWRQGPGRSWWNLAWLAQLILTIILSSSVYWHAVSFCLWFLLRRPTQQESQRPEISARRSLFTGADARQAGVGAFLVVMAGSVVQYPQSGAAPVARISVLLLLIWMTVVGTDGFRGMAGQLRGFLAPLALGGLALAVFGRSSGGSLWPLTLELGWARWYGDLMLGLAGAGLFVFLRCERLLGRLVNALKLAATVSMMIPEKVLRLSLGIYILMHTALLLLGTETSQVVIAGSGVAAWLFFSWAFHRFLLIQMNLGFLALAALFWGMFSIMQPQAAVAPAAFAVALLGLQAFQLLRLHETSPLTIDHVPLLRSLPAPVSAAMMMPFVSVSISGVVFGMAVPLHPLGILAAALTAVLMVYGLALIRVPRSVSLGSTKNWEQMGLHAADPV